MIEINLNNFYKIGVGCFTIIGLANIWTFFMFLDRQTIPSTISSWASILFNFVLVGLFYNLNKQMNPKIKTEYASDDISQLIEEIINSEVTK